MAILIGLVLLGLGSYLLIRHIIILKHGYISKGKVIEIVSERDKLDGSLIKFPIIRFKDSENKEQSLKLSFGSNLALFHLGQILTIAYYKNKIYLAESEWKIL